MQALGLLLALAPLSSAQGKVWIVDDDGGPGVDFTLIQEAVQAAADGDTLLLRSGEYGADDPYASPALIQADGKGLVVTADRGARVVLDATFPSVQVLQVTNLAAGQTFVLRGCELVGGFTSTSIVHLQGNQGSVRLEDCRVDAPKGDINQWALRASACDDVTLVRTQVLGHGAAIAAVGAFDSHLHLFACDVRGGHGLPGTFSPHGDGGAALRLDGGSLVAAGSTLRGGDGVDFAFPNCIPGIHAGDAGDGLQVLSGQTFLTDVALAPGAPGRSLTPGCPDGDPAVALLDPSGNVTVLPAPAHAARAESPVRAGHPVTILLTGRPGELAFAAFSHDPASVLQPALGGALLVGPPLAVLTAGPLESWGSATLSIAAPLLAPGVGTQTFHLQGAFLDPAGGAVLGGAQSLTVLAL